MATPVSAAALRQGDHSCLIYESDEERRAALVEFVKGGLERDERVTYLVGSRSPRDVYDELAQEGVDGDSASARGQLRVWPADEVYLADGRFEPDRMMERLRQEIDAAQRDGYSGSRFAAEMTWALNGHPGRELLVEYERALNEFYASGQPTGMCGYDRRHFTADMLDDICQAHPLQVEVEMPGSTFTLSSEPSGVLKLSGEVDLFNADLLASALSAAAPREGALRIDASELDFVDLAGLRVMYGAAGTRDAQLVLVSPTQIVRRLTELAELDIAIDPKESDRAG
jgi:anti-anti-sigma factor